MTKSNATTSNTTKPNTAKSKGGFPKCLSSVTGKLEMLGSGPGQFVIRDKTGKRYLLATGDKVSGNGWSARVDLTYTGQDKLNGSIGTHIMLPEEDVWGYNRHLFFWRMPVARENLQPWLDAYQNEEEVTVKFRIKPLAEPSDTFATGRLELFFEQGMERSAFAMFDPQKHSYAALYMPQVGDKLTILDASAKKVIWQGTLTQKRYDDLKSVIDPAPRDVGKKMPKIAHLLFTSAYRELPVLVEKKTPTPKG